ncbi:MAG: hypothetical protein J0I41_04350 [Filimonas sp.]|nr:hypothetical protein [Filimonas sp.]
MSVVTSIIIIFPYSESETERIAEINNYRFENKTYEFNWIDNEGLSYNYYSGNKNFNSVVLMASFNNFPTDDFLVFIATKIKWDEPEYVQILINSEASNDRTFRIYSNAGATCLQESRKW